ncbi:protein SPMIP1 [Ascaphus truei]|uniref:protein SPMIP1 n=1 Tax=Ascaphus truei TaxID=8439 RepID=UPI003F5AB7DB
MKDLLTTRNQNCWKELIDKETLTRMSWKLRFGQGQPQHLLETTRKRREVPIPKFPNAGGTPHLPLINVPKKPEVRVSEEKGQVHADQQIMADMRPVTPLTSHMLYEGFSKEGKGRYIYLKKRKQLGPEDKFPYPILSSWDYGWRLGDVVKEFRVPIHGRCKIVRDTFYMRNGVFCPPAHTDKML